MIGQFVPDYYLRSAIRTPGCKTLFFDRKKSRQPTLGAVIFIT
jgi:hypothetical protein